MNFFSVLTVTADVDCRGTVIRLTLTIIDYFFGSYLFVSSVTIFS